MVHPWFTHVHPCSRTLGPVSPPFARQRDALQPLQCSKRLMSKRHPTGTRTKHSGTCSKPSAGNRPIKLCFQQDKQVRNALISTLKTPITSVSKVIHPTSPLKTYRKQLTCFPIDSESALLLPKSHLEAPNHRFRKEKHGKHIKNNQKPGLFQPFAQLSRG